MQDLLRMEKTLHALVSGDDGAAENREHHDDSRQVLDAAIAEREAGARPLAGEHEGDGERDRGGRIGEVMDRIGEQRDAAGGEHHEQLQHGGDGKRNE